MHLQNKNTSQTAAIRSAPVSKGGTFIWCKGNVFFKIAREQQKGKRIKIIKYNNDWEDIDVSQTNTRYLPKRVRRTHKSIYVYLRE